MTMTDDRRWPTPPWWWWPLVILLGVALGVLFIITGGPQ